MASAFSSLDSSLIFMSIILFGKHQFGGYASSDSRMSRKCVEQYRQMSTRRGSTEVHEFDAMFLGSRAHYKVTSVIGHVFSVDFPAAFQDWTNTNPSDLFQAPVLKKETNPKASKPGSPWLYTFDTVVGL
ncbi:DNA topoisomerase 3-beta-like isoform X2 [Capsicum annuum]|uniref:DNA topoisomerase 3-beta-like isoform X2 n=1 Tax=Capsicum annuum TaxID=4072 RepID=UPI001FB06255|nr:DNA topoisomerase 3-beta-like isoform X2 [Capsicum annuum]